MDAQESKLVRLLIADHNPTFRAGLCRAIESEKEIQVIKDVGSADRLFDIEKKKVSHINVAIIDIDLPKHQSILAARWVAKKNPDCVVLFLCNRDWDIYLVAAWLLQAAGVLFRCQSSKDLISNIKGALFGPIFTQEQFQRIIRWQETIGAKLLSLLPGEKQVLKLIVAGKKNSAIARLLDLSENMVEKYVSRILKKMQLKSRTQLLSYILENHLDTMLDLDIYK